MLSRRSIFGVLAAVAVFVGLLFSATAWGDASGWPPHDSARDSADAPPAPVERTGPFAGTPKDKIPGRLDGQRTDFSPEELNQGPLGARPTGDVLAERQRAVEGKNDRWICYSADGLYVTDVIVTLADPKIEVTKEQRDDICKRDGADRSTEK